MGSLETIATQYGIDLWLLVIILIWTLVWKLVGMWKSARKGHVAWFIIIALFNTVGILSILYVYVFSKMPLHKKPLYKKLNSKKKTSKKKSNKKNIKKKK